jgi:hypothetical protein
MTTTSYHVLDVGFIFFISDGNFENDIGSFYCFLLSPPGPSHSTGSGESEITAYLELPLEKPKHLLFRFLLARRFGGDLFLLGPFAFDGTHPISPSRGFV